MPSTPKPILVFDPPLTPATFLARPNRFVVHCSVEGYKRPVVAHLPDPGRLRELLVPGRSIWLRRVPREEIRAKKRRTRWTAVLTQTPDGNGLVSLDTMAPNRLIRHALEARAIDELSDWEFDRAEFPLGHSRVDFVLRKAGNRRLALEVKSVTLVEDGIGLFPDAVTARGTRHLHALMDVIKQPNWRAAVLFLVQRSDVTCVRAAPSIDADFAAALAAAKGAGVMVLGRRCSVTLDGITLGDAVAVV